jgi:hypothetical protein
MEIECEIIGIKIKKTPNIDFLELEVEIPMKFKNKNKDIENLKIGKAFLEQ